MSDKPSDTERLARVALHNPVVQAVLCLGGTAVDCVENLATFVDDLQAELQRQAMVYGVPTRVRLTPEDVERLRKSPSKIHKMDPELKAVLDRLTEPPVWFSARGMTARPSCWARLKERLRRKPKDEGVTCGRCGTSLASASDLCPNCDRDF